MTDAQCIDIKHNGRIHGIVYDHYGQRFATSSDDCFVKVWDQDKFGNWNLSSTWKPNDTPVWKLLWAHPEFGQALVTCSVNNTVTIWEEIILDDNSSVWGEMGNDAMDVADETTETDFHFNKTPVSKKKKSANKFAESFTQKSAEVPIKAECNNCTIWIRKCDIVNQTFRISDMKFSPHYLGLILTLCSSDGIIRIYESREKDLSQWCQEFGISSTVLWSCLSWTYCIGSIHLPLVAFGSNEENKSPKVVIYEYRSDSRTLVKSLILDEITKPVNDVAFAPTVDHSYHLLGVASTNVTILKIDPTMDDIGKTLYNVSIVAKFENANDPMDIYWNPLGTILAASCADGCVQLWKSQADTWKCVNIIKADPGKSPSLRDKYSTPDSRYCSNEQRDSSILEKHKFLKLSSHYLSL